MNIPIITFGPEIAILNIGKKNEEGEIRECEESKDTTESIIICECGGSYMKKGKGGHYRTKAHTNYFKSIA